MKTYYWLVVAMLVAAVAPLPTAAAYAENVALTITNPSGTACMPWDETQEALGAEPSCATGTLSGIIKRCWATSDELADCEVQFTGSLNIGPFVTGLFASDAGTISKTWNPSDLTPRTRSMVKVVPNVPRAGGDVEGGLATVQVKFVGLTPTETTTWTPIYTFPRDPTYNPPSGCTSGSASASTAGASVGVLAEDLGISESVTISPMRSSSTSADPDSGGQAKVMVAADSPGC